MIVVLYITILLLGLYGLLFFFYHNWWLSVPVFTKEANSIHDTAITVIVPARNEAANIKSCIDSLLDQTYPKHLLEIIVVNDHSEDNTAALVLSYQSDRIRLLDLEEKSNAPKKKAIETAIALAKGTLIVCTDADCVAGKEWISTIAGYFKQTDSVFIAAPVNINAGSGILSKFQSLDFLTMQGITAAAVYRRIHNMCNGANLAYEKNAFMAVDGFNGVDNIASGDDMLLMSKVSKKFPSRVNFLKSSKAIVNTNAAADWNAFFQQRIRWASKATYYNDPRIFMVLLLVYLVNIFTLSFFFAGFFHYQWWFCFLGLCVLKFLLELSFVRSVAQFFDQQKLLPYLLLLQPIHIFYIVVSGFLGQVKTYTWKGRKLR